MTHINDLFTPAALAAAQADGLVRARRHPELPLTMYSYTARAQYQDVWDDVTRTCRGLIVDDEGLVRARPWPKFFEYRAPAPGQPKTVDLGQAAEVTDKLDGSLGILYPGAGGAAVATRGAFDSEQAVHATQLYRDRYAGRWTPNPELTYLFEIIYPGNRIVVDYDDVDDLFLLGACRLSDGAGIPLGEITGWPGPRTETMPARTLAEALALAPRPGAEGLVATLRDGGVKLKIKQADYLRLHKIVTGTTPLTVWEHLSEKRPLGELVEGTPDEFHAWLRETAAGFEQQYGELLAEAQAAYGAILAELGDAAPRRDFARAALAYGDLKHLLFGLADDKMNKVDAAIWRTLRPTENGPEATQSSWFRSPAEQTVGD